MMKKSLVLPVILSTIMLAACNLPARLPATGPISTPQATLPVLNTPVSLALPLVSSPQIVLLQMVDASNGWALGETKIMRTMDGGATWYDATPSGVVDVGYSIAYFFTDTDTAWVVTAGADPTTGTLYHTVDGGRTWTSASVPFSGGFLYFTDSLTGWDLIGLGAAMSHEAVAIFRTTDGGSTWTQVFTDDPTASGSTDTLPFVGDKSGLAAASGSTAWVTGAQPSPDFVYVYISQDGGVTWAQQSFTLPAEYAGGMTGAYPPVFFGSENGVLPVGLYSNTSGTVFYRSSDGGLTWSPTIPVASMGRYSIASQSDFFVWDGGSSLYTSQDAGTTWNTITPNINISDTLASFQFINATTGWAVASDASNHYSLYKTMDGGTTWSVLIP
jgi:photosystem II stability/assembly factor-like uncharacterized protein